MTQYCNHTEEVAARIAEADAERRAKRDEALQAARIRYAEMQRRNRQRMTAIEWGMIAGIVLILANWLLTRGLP